MMDKPYRSWPLLILAAPASVAVWSGWVGLGTMTGFGSVRPLPGIADGFTINTAITLPIGVEAYGAYALGAWLSRRRLAEGTRRFACISAVGALLLGMLGQVAFHLLEVAHKAKVADIAEKTGRTVEQVNKAMPAQAPWWIVTVVACFPVLVLGMGATLAHLIHRDARGENRTVAPAEATDALPESGEVREGVADGYPLWDQIEPEPEPARNAPRNVPEESRNAFPWGSVNVSEPWPLPRVNTNGESPLPRLVSVGTGTQKNGDDSVSEVFSEQVNGHPLPPPQDVPDGPEDLDPETLKNARETFSAEIAAGESLKVREVMRRCSLGYDKAKKIKEVLDPRNTPETPAETPPSNGHKEST